ncbi:MAG: hypothetical protein IPM79_27100 [Polyangiaceae bacterium]|nr:hypothetical protein [Polyangiaceae bacterium]
MPRARRPDDGGGEGGGRRPWRAERPVTRALRVAVLAALLFVGCKTEGPDATPEGVVRELVERLQRLNGGEQDAKAAFELLSQRTRENLEDRAKRYTAASGKRIDPEMMIAPQSFVQRFDVRSYETVPSGPGFAVVRVHGVAEGEVAEVHCVFEDGGWRVDIELPPLAPVVVRPREEAPPPRR